MKRLNELLTSAIAAPTPEIWLMWGDSIGVGVSVRDGPTDLDWAGVFQVRWRAPTGINADITPLDQAIALDGNSYLSPMEYFGKQRTADIAKNIYLVPYNSNGSSFSPGAWGVGQTLHEAFITRANTAIATVLATVPTAKVAGIIQIEGSNDANVGTTPLTYETALTAAIADMRSRIFANGVSGANIASSAYIINGMIPDYLNTPDRVSYELALRRVANAITNGKFLRIPEGYNSGDNLHPSLAGSRYYGTASAGLVSKTTGPILSGIVGAGTFNVYAAQKMLIELSADEYAFYSLSGAGASDFEIVWLSDYNSGIGYSRLKQYLRWNGDGTKTAGTYTVTVNAKNGAGKITSQSFTVNVAVAYGTSSTGPIVETARSFLDISEANVVSPYKTANLTFGAGLNLIYIYANGSTTGITSLKVNGVEAVLMKAQGAGDISQIWGITMPVGLTGKIDMVYTGSLAQSRIQIISLTNTLATPTFTDTVDVGFKSAPLSGASLTCSANGIIVGMGIMTTAFNNVGAGCTLISGPNGTDGVYAAKRTTTGAIQITGSNGFASITSLAFDKAP